MTDVEQERAVRVFSQWARQQSMDAHLAMTGMDYFLAGWEARGKADDRPRRGRAPKEAAVGERTPVLPAKDARGRFLKKPQS